MKVGDLVRVGDLVVRNMGGIVFKDRKKGIVLGIRQVDNETYYKIAWVNNKGKNLVSDRWRREEFTLIQSAK